MLHQYDMTENKQLLGNACLRDLLFQISIKFQVTHDRIISAGKILI